MKLKSLEGVLQFYDGAGVEHKPDADGHFVSDHATTVAEMVKAGFVMVEETISAVVDDVEYQLKRAAGIGTRLLSDRNGNEVGFVAETPKTGDTLHDDEGREVQVLSVSQDGKTAVTGLINHETTLSEEEQVALETAKALRKTEGPLIDVNKPRTLSADEAAALASASLGK